MCCQIFIWQLAVNQFWPAEFPKILNGFIATPRVLLTLLGLLPGWNLDCLPTLGAQLFRTCPFLLRTLYCQNGNQPDKRMIFYFIGLSVDSNVAMRLSIRRPHCKGEDILCYWSHQSWPWVCLDRRSKLRGWCRCVPHLVLPKDKDLPFSMLCFVT